MRVHKKTSYCQARQAMQKLAICDALFKDCAIIATETKVMLLRQRAAKFKSTLHRYKKIIWTHSKTSNIAKQIINRCLKCLSICCSSRRTHKKPSKNI